MKAAAGRSALCAGAAAAVLVWLLQRRGLPLGPDAFSYWGASVSLLDGDGYLDAHGLPVLEWPPLYPLWLQVVQAMLGVSLHSVAVANALLLGLAAGLAVLWVLRATGGGRGPRDLVVGAHAAAFAVLSARTVQAETLMLAALFGLLLALDLARRSVTRRGHGLAVAAAVLAATAALLARNAALAFLPAAAWMVLRLPGRGAAARTAAAAALLAVPAACWWAVRVALGQTGSHDADQARQLGYTLWYMLTHIDRMVAPFPLGLLLAASLALLLGPLARRSAARLGIEPGVLRQGGAVAFVGIALASLLTMFLLVQIHDDPGERFVGFAAWMLVGLGLGALRHARSRAAYAVLAVLLAGPCVVRAGGRLLRPPVVRDDVTATGGERWLPAHAMLAPRLPPGTTLADGRVVVAAPLFAWQAERLRRGEGRR